MKRKKIFIDVIFNIIANTIPIVVLQLIVYPVIAKQLGSENYGLMLTIYSIWCILPMSLGTILNNTRLILDEQYRKNNIQGDFNIMYLICSIVGSIVVFFLTLLYYKNANMLHYILSALIGILITSRGYFEVGLRIKLDYKSVAKMNFLQSLGYLIGFLLFFIVGWWELIFFFGYAFSSLYSLFKTKLLNEKFRWTKLRFVSIKYALNLGAATIISNSVTYADKLVLYPLMGGEVVSIYFTATILGKMIGMIMGPMNSVLLSYLSKMTSFSKNMMKKVLIAGTLIVTIGYFIVLILGKPIIYILYPQWLEPVMHIFPLTTVTIMINVLISLLNPIILKFCSISWQITITLLTSIVYFSAAMLLWNLYGIVGFCIGTIIGKVANLLLLLFAYYREQK